VRRIETAVRRRSVDHPRHSTGPEERDGEQLRAYITRRYELWRHASGDKPWGHAATGISQVHPVPKIRTVATDNSISG
jgi:hypothetical protein